MAQADIEFETDETVEAEELREPVVIDQEPVSDK